MRRKKIFRHKYKLHPQLLILSTNAKYSISNTYFCNQKYKILHKSAYKQSSGATIQLPSIGLKMFVRVWEKWGTVVMGPIDLWTSMLNICNKFKNRLIYEIFVFKFVLQKLEIFGFGKVKIVFV